MSMTMNDTQEKATPRTRKNWGEDSREERHEDERPLPGGAARGKEEKDQVEEESEESFPASDPPSFTPSKIG